MTQHSQSGSEIGDLLKSMLAAPLPLSPHTKNDYASILYYAMVLAWVWCHRQSSTSWPDDTETCVCKVPSVSVFKSLRHRAAGNAGASLGSMEYVSTPNTLRTCTELPSLAPEVHFAFQNIYKCKFSTWHQ